MTIKATELKFGKKLVRGLLALMNTSKAKGGKPIQYEQSYGLIQCDADACVFGILPQAGPETEDVAMARD